MVECRLTTVDNPYDPFEQFDEWAMFDNDKGYNSCGYLARIVEISDTMSEEEEQEAVNKAIDSIIFYDPIGLYKKVYRKDSEITQ